MFRLKTRHLLYIVPCFVVIFAGFASNVYSEDNAIPSWVKSTAKYWANGDVGDSEFIKGIQYLIDQKILVVSQSTNATETNGKTYLDDTFKFSISQPDNWERQMSAGDQSGTKMVQFIESSTIDTAQVTSIILGVENMKGLSFDNYLKVSKENIKQMFASQNFTLTNEGKTKVNNMDAYYVDYVLTVGIPFNMKAIIIPHNGNAYLFMYMGEAESYNKHFDQFEKILSTLKFL